MNRDLEWREPPATAISPSRHFTRTIASELRDKPGEWAIVSKHRNYTGAKQKIYYVQQAKTGGWAPAGAFEAMMDPATFEVYVRFVGES